MALSFVMIFVHVVFSTRNREPSIEIRVRARRHEYLGGIVRASGGHALAINGMADHVHILMTLPADKSIADMMRLVKANSSRWVHETLANSKNFSWQTGYSAFGVSQSAVQRVSKYIAEQEKHHAKLSFEDEYRKLLRLHGLSFEEKYVWG